MWLDNHFRLCRGARVKSWLVLMVQLCSTGREQCSRQAQLFACQPAATVVVDAQRQRRFRELVFLQRYRKTEELRRLRTKGQSEIQKSHSKSVFDVLMDFRIADTFTDSLGRLTGDEQKVVKTTAFDLQLNPVSPGMQFHKLDKAKDKNFWSVRVNADIRLIVHKTSNSLLLCYVDHHDGAYSWAERRKLQSHPKTGAAQLVEIRETVQEIVIPRYVEQEQPKPKTLSRPLFAALSEETLLGYGVPQEWLDDVHAATEDSLFALVEHLPAEAAEALLELATGGQPRVLQPIATAADAFEHPDALRRFRVIANVEELARALDYPWDRWTVFLHPDQRQFVEREYTGPARISGSAGTGKTIVALHRAVYLARTNPDSRVLLTSFSDALASNLQTRLNRLVSGEPRLAERIDVYSLATIAQRLYRMHIGPVSLANRAAIKDLLGAASQAVGGHKFSDHFLLTEWEQVVDAWQLDSWEAYRDVARLGRKTRLPETQRQVLWSIFEKVRSVLSGKDFITEAMVYARLAGHFVAERKAPFDFAVIDEAQDLSVSQMRVLAALGSGRPNALFFAGDLGQRIFQQPFSWKSLGVDVRGRSRTLRVNYRTSHQIRMQADRLLGPTVTDVDGNSEDRSDTVSVFNGPPPTIRQLGSEEEEIKVVADWIVKQASAGVVPHEFGLFVRSPAQLARATDAVSNADLPYKTLDESGDGAAGHVSISTMHLAKGLEFRAVAVMACDDEVIPLQERIETVGDDADLQEVYDTERQLLYVACTRARDHLLVTSVEPASEFLDDLRQ
jgi:mRNA-degrading endonuclease RelE of RelBE toxin-antitoxin system